MRSDDRIAGAIYGHLIGDALGVPYEGMPRVGAVEWGAGGGHDRPAGTWSDDGALTLALLDSLLDVGFDPADQARRFLAWWERGSYTPDGVSFGIGGATYRALSRVAAGVSPEVAGDDPKALGNGSLMRSLPIALVDPGASSAQLVERAHRSSRITHGAPACLVACALYVLVARELLAAPERPTAFARSTELLRTEYQRIGDPAMIAALEALLAWPPREGRGHVSDSFWSAWDAFAGADGYRSTVVRAIQYGNDTDTTAAIAGGLAGLYWGEPDIPQEWRDGLRGKEVVEPLLNRLTRSLDARERP
jgi:ADP-ribosyl-[dinitrogen reductase] hydrolase